MFSRFNSEQSALLASNIFLTGGGVNIDGFATRVENEVRMNRPFQSQIGVSVANDPIFDAWRGAAAFASSEECQSTQLTRAAYAEYGPSAMRTSNHHRFSNFYPAAGDGTEKKARYN
jgi:actin-related protein 5